MNNYLLDIMFYKGESLLETIDLGEGFAISDCISLPIL